MGLAWLLDRLQEDLAVEVKFKMYSLRVLLYELAREENKFTDTSLSLSSLSFCDTRVPTISNAEVQLDRDMFIYTPGLSCSWHEDMETFLLTTAANNRWSYIVNKEERDHPLKAWKEQLSTDMSSEKWGL